jgi:hypothetical protein
MAWRAILSRRSGYANLVIYVLNMHLDLGILHVLLHDGLEFETFS